MLKALAGAELPVPLADEVAEAAPGGDSAAAKKDVRMDDPNVHSAGLKSEADWAEENNKKEADDQ